MAGFLYTFYIYNSNSYHICVVVMAVDVYGKSVNGNYKVKGSYAVYATFVHIN